MSVSDGMYDLYVAGEAANFFIKCVSAVLCSIHKDELITFITMPKCLILLETYLIYHDSFTAIHSGSSKSVYEQQTSRSAGGLILIKHL